MTVASGFPMPQRIVVDEATATEKYAKFTISPFMNGFGHTLGNALRRVLLSSMEGAAISAVRIDGAFHEFSTLPNVIEDVTEIVLNLKNVRLKLHSEQDKTLEIISNKAGEVTAADIVTDGTVEVLNPEQVICTLDKDVAFRAEIDVIRGRGYLPVSKNPKAASQPIGSVAVDCLFSPVTRVNYHVGAARIGEETEMDSLGLEIWTDGRIAPDEALQLSAVILKDHLRPFLGGQADEEDVMAQMSDEELKLFKVLSQDVEVLDLSVRAMNCLNNANIKLIGELCSKTESRMLKYRNFGKKSLDEIKEKINNLGLELGMTLGENLLAAIEAESDAVRADDEEDRT